MLCILSLRALSRYWLLTQTLQCCSLQNTRSTFSISRSMVGDRTKRGTRLEHLDNCLLMNVTQLCAASLGLRENIKALLSSGWVKCKALTSNSDSLQKRQPTAGMHLVELDQLQLSRVARTLSEPVPVSLSDVESPVC